MANQEEELHKKLVQEWQQKKDKFDKAYGDAGPDAKQKIWQEYMTWAKLNPKPDYKPTISSSSAPAPISHGAITMTSSSQNQNTAQSRQPPGLDVQAIADKLKITNPKITGGNTLTLGDNDNIKIIQSPSKKVECAGPMSEADIKQAVKAFILQNVNVTNHIVNNPKAVKDGIPTAPFNPLLTPQIKSDGSPAAKALEQRFLAKFNELTAAPVLGNTRTATTPATPTMPTAKPAPATPLPNPFTLPKPKPK